MNLFFDGEEIRDIPLRTEYVTGPAGPTGAQGQAGLGIITGGITGQVLAKKSDNDYDVEWINQSGGITGVTWGSITGFLANQIDLQNALNNKAPSTNIPVSSITGLATIAISGSYNDLLNKPTIPNAQINSDWGSITGVSQILNKPNLAIVATSGSYNDLIDKPTIPSGQVNSDWSSITGISQILNKPSLAVVATSGSYTDLLNKPTIPDAQVNSDWSAITGISQILNKPNLSVVATSGSYNDLLNKPTIPDAQVNSDWSAITGISQILNKPNLSAVATSGSYNDLIDKPTIPDAQINSDWDAISGISEILNKPNLSVVATSGSYNDLLNRPTIPDAQVNSDWSAITGISQILNKPNLSVVATSGSYTDLSNKPTYSDVGAAPASGISPSAISGTAVITTDFRLSDSRTPTIHKSTHAIGGSDVLTPSDIGAQPAGNYAPASGISPSAISGTAVITTDSRLSDSRIPTGTANGDLSGTYPNPTVDGLQGRPVSSNAPTSGQVLQFDGTNWTPGQIPSGGSGGGGLVYYLNYQNTTGISPTTGLPTSPVAPSQLGRTYSVGSGSITSSNLTDGSYSLICGFVTISSEPNVTDIPAGLWDFNIWADVLGGSGSANQTQFQVRIYKYRSSNSTYTLIASSDDVFVYDPATTVQYIANVTMPQTTILATDRIYVELWAQKNVNQSRQIKFYFDSLHPSHCHTTLPSVSGTGIVKVINGVLQSPATLILDDDVSESAAIAQSKISGLTSSLAGKSPASGISASAISGTAVITTDSRLSDARTPTAHKSTHAIGGADPLTAADIGAAGLQSSDPDSTANCITNLYGSGDQICTIYGILNSKNSYNWTNGTGDSYYVFWDGSRWVARYSYTGDGDFDVNYYSTGNVLYPWLANWTGSGALVIRSGVNITSDLGSSSAGIATTASRSDHVHNLPTKSQIGLGAVDNTSDANKPVSTAQQTALNAKANISSIQIFTSSGTWTKPTGAKSVNVQLFGAGGGGGGGRKNTSTLTAKFGGGGGGGGSYLNVNLPASVLAATESISIGAGGTGGIGQTANGNGGSGTAGGSTSFNSIIASGGGGGTGGTVNSGNAGNGVLNAHVGGVSSATVTANSGAPVFASSTTLYGGAGGGAGGGISATGSPFDGGGGGRSNVLNYSGGNGGSSTGGAGTAGTTNTNATAGLFVVGSGGGGGGGGFTVSAGAGGAGGFPAGGGGGGGATETGTTSGAGGAGAAGIAVITTYF